MRKSNRIIFPIIGLLLIFLAVAFLHFKDNLETQAENIAEQFNNNLILQANVLSNINSEYESVLNTYADDYWPLLESVGENSAHFVFIYRNNELLYWNTSSVLFKDLPKRKGTFIVNNSDSWFLADYNQIGQFEILLLKPIIINYNVENQYISKRVNNEFSDFENIEIEKEFGDKCYKIENFNEKNYFLKINSNIGNANNFRNLPLILLSLYILFVLIISQLTSNLFTGKYTSVYSFFIMFIIIIVFRWFDWYYSISLNIVDSEALRQALFSFPLFSTLWDLLVTSVILIILVITNLKKHLLVLPLSGDRNTGIYQFIYILLLLFTPYFVLELLTAVLCSLGFYETSYLFTKATGFVSLLSITLFGLTLYILLRSIKVFINNVKINYVSLILGLISFLVIVIIFCKCTLIYLIISILLVIFTFGLEYLISKRKQIFLLHHLIYIIILSASFSYVINQSVQLNKNELQNNISDFLNQSGNIEIETFWKQFKKDIDEDLTLLSLVDSDTTSDKHILSDYIIEKYLNELGKGIDIQITICSEDEMLSLENEDIVVNCNYFFQDLKLSSISVTDSNLFLISSEPDNIYYLGEINSAELSFYIEFYTFYVPTGLGYAELLVDRKNETPDLSEFSFAKYHDDILISKFGSYEYHTTANIFNSFRDSVFFELNGFMHLKVVSGNGDILIVSRNTERLSTQMISFSILVLIFSVLFLLGAFLVYGKKFKILFSLNFRARLQLFFMIALISILFSTAIIILYYADRNNKMILENQLNEKAHSVLIELQHKLSNYKTLENVDREQLGLLLQKFSLVFFSDINVYDTHGKIVASSRPQIFEEGLLSEMVNSRAFEEIFVDNLLYYNCTEKIGDLEYLSSYLPLMLTAAQPAGIINLPYFARQNEKRQSFSLLLFTFINLFVILGILGTIIAVFYSRLLTKPLTELQKNIANIRIDMQNEKIEWQSDDEIGQLIDEYNSMVDKLEASAEILKRSERETAWREVARQIAHEIKNPLTPMKLNIQYLEKIYFEKDSEFGVKLKDISHTLIQQIDTLDKVAEMFSDMAKSNISDFKQIDLLSVIKSAVKLYEKSDNINFEINVDNDKVNFLTKGVRKDLVRVFNNLIKNSVEAIGSSENGKIEISIASGDSYHTIKITDNGNGIPRDKMNIIFTPYFTTRTKGTGLGLAIVKTIVNDMGGDIKLGSTSEEGTTFELKFLISGDI